MVVIAAKQPRLWFARAAKLLVLKSPSTGVDASAEVSPDAVLGEGVSVGPCAVIGANAVIGKFTRVEAGAVIGERVIVGEHCRIYPRVVVYAGTEIGNRVVVHAGVVLGADGFGYVRDREMGAYTQFPQQGELIIEDDVEIGANSTIDRGALAETRIRRGVKIDNLVHIGHNCDIGEDVVIAALTGISGSSSVGKGAVIAGQVGIGDHAHVGPGVILGGQAGVLSGKSETRTGTVLWGTPAKPLREYLRELAAMARLAKRKKD
jgi:UDP-3-O-[3-hydroxymyristoyl] glucosamine N-acyltransferase